MTQEELEEKMVNDAFNKLLKTYLDSPHRKKVDVIIRAFNFAKKAHNGVRRLSGEPYIMHPIAVAQIVCEEIGMGSTSICAALLHDVEEDTDYTNEDIKNLFGQQVADIVEGLTKIAGGIFGEKASLQAETFKKLLITMSKDVRVILIKISDRLHNMRTLSSMRPSKQYKIAGETLYIYAPLADRLGLNKIKLELENLSFRYEHPEEYKMIEGQLSQTEESRTLIFQDFTPPIREALDKLPIEYKIISRVKTPYSIWNKIQKKHISFEEIFDILAIRIIFTPQKPEDEIALCFNIYAALTQIYKSHPDRLRDWVTHPKANGYQALHTTLMSHTGEWIEVQIRSKRMDEIDEKGLAAHWNYKDSHAAKAADAGVDNWLHSIKEILDDPQPDTLDLLNTIKLNFFASEIVVFTPKGEVKTMPSNATTLDFAFSIHTVLGTHCIGAKVNHQLVPINHVLKGGDQVEILTSRQQQVKREWLNYATTAKAKSKIQACLRKMDRELQNKGLEQLTAFLQKHEMETTSDTMDRLRIFHQKAHKEQFLQSIGEGTITLSNDDINYLKGKKKNKANWKKLIPFFGTNQKTAPNPEVSDQEFIAGINRKKTLQLTDNNINHCTICPCCFPIPGDDALGYIASDGSKLHIHKRDCPEALRLKSQFGQNIIAVNWDVHNQLFKTTLSLSGIDAEGTLLSIAQSLYSHPGINVTALNISSNEGIFEAQITVYTHSTAETFEICQSLRSIKNILKAIRI